MEYPLLSLELAREIEMAEAQAAVGCAERLRAALGDEAAAVAEVAGGFAIYCGANSPVTQAVGLGLNGAVSKEEFDRLEEFYFSRKEPVRLETCPMADGTLIEHYRERGYYVSEFSNVMVRPVEKTAAAVLPGGIEIQKAAEGEIDLWTLTVSQGFAEHYPVTQELLGIMRMFAEGKNTECYFAKVDGKIAGGATLALRGRIAGLFGASTLPQFRNRGVQTALLEARMERAAERGCELAMSIALPGSASQRNITRRGFRTLYTRVKFERQLEAGSL
ncbi:MAG TPA: GNAT family N-acetyltransferase [Candidatus Acidoferrum sp.]|nr:GNAT family N-acetyltransferase [Candidatus Acidoferrum sp.]